MLKNGFSVDGVKWIIGEHPRQAVPLCPRDFIKLDAVDEIFPDKELKCEECGTIYSLPRKLSDEIRFVLNKIDANVYKGMSYINLDDEALPLAKEKVPTNSKYFVTSLLTRSKVGLRLIVYAGEKDNKKKTQIFVEPEIKRLAFDQKDLHPVDIFAKFEATFADGSKASQKRK